MPYYVLLIILIAAAVISLTAGILTAVKYGKMYGARMKDTEGKPLPTAMGSMTHRMGEERSGQSIRKEKTVYMTKGKEAGINFSLSYPELRKGLKEGDQKVKLQFAIITAFVLFFTFTFLSIGTGIIAAGNMTGWIFAGAGIFVFLIFLYQLFFGKQKGSEK